MKFYVNTSAISEYDRVAYIRVGTNRRPLKEFPSLEKELWSKVLSYDFENAIVRSRRSIEEVKRLLNLDAFLSMRQYNVAVPPDKLLDEAINVGLLKDNRDGTYDITNLGALLYANSLSDFPRLSSKNVRIIKYRGTSRLESVNEYRSEGGYAVSFDALLWIIRDWTADGEEVGDDGLRKKTYPYPPIMIRELFVNMLIHQDLLSDMIHPMVEIFDDRIEFTNAGVPLIPVERFIDYPPQTRNHHLAEETFKIGISESRGSGWDKVAIEAGDNGFPAPRPDVTSSTTRVIVSKKRNLSEMTNEERMWTLYIHACLLWTNKKFVTNTSVRELFNIPNDNLSMASNLLSQAQKSHLIRVFDPEAGPKSRKYVPIYVEEYKNDQKVQ